MMMTMRLCRPRPLARGQQGLSLVELAVSLAIVGILGLIAWRWIASTRAPLDRPAIMSQLAEAQTALEGYVLAHSKLPCAAADTNGNADCAAAAPIFFPWRTLGMDRRFAQLHYGVNRAGGIDLAPTASVPDSVRPDLFFDYPTLDGAFPMNPLPVINDAGVDAAVGRLNRAISGVAGVGGSNSRRTAVNGLDWCRLLRSYASLPNPSAAGVLEAGTDALTRIPVAFILVHPGMNGVFEGNNATGGAFRFDMPGRPQSHEFDDLALAVGPADLSARLGCPTHLGRMQAAAQGAYTAYDTARLVQEYWSLRVFDIDQARSAVESAETGELLAGMNLALAVADAALAVASAANTEGITIFGIALSAASAVAAGVELGFAVAEVANARNQLQAAITQEAATRIYMAHVYDSFTQALTAAVTLDTKGLNP